MKPDHKSIQILNLMSPHKKDSILVIGTGAYPKIEFFLNHIYKCSNITSGDIDKENLKNAKKILPELKFVYLDAQKKFPFKSNTFDKVIFTDVLEHLPNEKIALGEINRVLKASGNLIISVPKKRWFNLFSPITHFQHVREYNEHTITKALKESNFKIDSLMVGGNILNLIGLWLHLILKYAFHYFHTSIFFDRQINKTYEKGFKGKGTDIIIKASPIK